MYIFGYGSLIWKQGFVFDEKITGFIKGFKRRFWHGSEDHRGVPGSPGRVVSISQSDDETELVWGVTFKIHPDNVEQVRRNLIERETGYDIVKTVFYPENERMEPFELEVFMATEEADEYLGPASNKDIAWQIYHSHGRCGPNVEYLMKLIYYHRQLFPQHRDGHLEELDVETQAIAKSKGDILEDYDLHEF